MITKDSNDRDSNDNIIDRITGKEIRKPGDEQKHDDIVVPSVGGGGEEVERSRARGEVEEEGPERRARAVGRSESTFDEVGIAFARRVW